MASGPPGAAGTEGVRPEQGSEGTTSSASEAQNLCRQGGKAAQESVETGGAGVRWLCDRVKGRRRDRVVRGTSKNSPVQVGQKWAGGRRYPRWPRRPVIKRDGGGASHTQDGGPRGRLGRLGPSHHMNAPQARVSSEPRGPRFSTPPPRPLTARRRAPVAGMGEWGASVGKPSAWGRGTGGAALARLWLPGTVGPPELSVLHPSFAFRHPQSFVTAVARDRRSRRSDGRGSKLHP